jgi:hypothetical protein
MPHFLIIDIIDATDIHFAIIDYDIICHYAIFTLIIDMISHIDIDAIHIIDAIFAAITPLLLLIAITLPCHFRH